MSDEKQKYMEQWAAENGVVLSEAKTLFDSLRWRVANVKGFELEANCKDLKIDPKML